MSDLVKFPKTIPCRPVARFYEFGPFRLDLERRLLLRNLEVVALTPRLFETLEVLIENRGRLISKDELMKKLWPDTVVEEANLAVSVSALRKLLGDSAGEHRYILTVPGRGYR
ncbi:MAG TPA: transcriptional regulator, partial [Blastocatellia bacterium]